MEAYREPKFPDRSKRCRNADDADHTTEIFKVSRKSSYGLKNGDQKAHYRMYVRFRRYLSCLRVLLVGVDHAANQGLTSDDRETAHSHASKCEPRDPSGPASNASEDDGIGNKFQIEDAVNDGNIDIPENAVITHYQDVEAYHWIVNHTKSVRWLS